MAVLRIPILNYYRLGVRLAGKVLDYAVRYNKHRITPINSLLPLNRQQYKVSKLRDISYLIGYSLL